MSTYQFRHDRAGYTGPLRVHIESTAAYGAAGLAGLGQGQGFADGIINLAGLLKAADGSDYNAAGTAPGEGFIPPEHRLTVYRGATAISSLSFVPVETAPGIVDINTLLSQGRAVAATPEQLLSLAAVAAELEQQNGTFGQTLTAIQAALADTEQSQEQNRLAVATLLSGGGNTAGSVDDPGALRDLTAVAGDYAVVRLAQAVYQKQADGTWSDAIPLTAPAVTVATPPATASWQVNALKGAALYVPRCRLGRVLVQVLARHTNSEADLSSANLMEVVIYDGQGVKITSSGLWEIPEIGTREIPVKPIEWPGGMLYVALTSNNTTTARFGDVAVPGVTATRALPAPATISVSAAAQATRAPAVTVLPDTPLRVKRSPTYTVMPANVMGKGSVGGNPYGVASNRVTRSTDGGVTWVQQSAASYTTTLPAGESPIDMVPWENSDGTLKKAFIMCTGGSVLEYDAATDAWSNISPPARHSQAQGRPKNIELWTSAPGVRHLLYGEYTNKPNEIPDDPYVFRRDLQTGTWYLSGTMTLSRHIHSFLPNPLGQVFCSVGDASVGDTDTGVGVWVLEPSGIGAGTGGNTDNWQKLTGAAPTYTNHYPVDMVMLTDAAGLPDRLIMSSDRPGIHLLQTKLKGKYGRFNQSALCWQPNSNAGETCHSLTLDSASPAKNVYYLTGETPDPGLYMAPSPYTRPIKIHDFPSQPTMFRMVIDKGFLFMGTNRWSLVEAVSTEGAVVASIAALPESPTPPPPEPVVIPPTGTRQPNWYNYLAWTDNPETATSTALLTSGTLWVMYARAVSAVGAGGSLSAIYRIMTAASALTLGRVAVYRASDGARVAVSADLSADWVGAAGYRKTTLTVEQPFGAGDGLYLAALAIGSGVPTLVAAPASNVINANTDTTAGSYLKRSGLTGKADIPASIGVLGSSQGASLCPWMALT
ncbi:hypothetical protein HLB42_21485 (plasmid) [Deinococcus sp. D7000]|nr:hypothetical protein HLB42_13760 [Deinococcus sp. D7000]QLG13514.1 hypothetical protein HLB42_21485 [Deinococcus sp. D7000]